MSDTAITEDTEGQRTEDDKADKLAAMVIEHRESAGYSQREFAEMAGISRSTLSRIEGARLYPSGKVRRRLAKAMDLSPADLWRPGDSESSE